LALDERRKTGMCRLAEDPLDDLRDCLTAQGSEIQPFEHTVALGSSH
jgi:hypothetical protein